MSNSSRNPSGSNARRKSSSANMPAPSPEEERIIRREGGKILRTMAVGRSEFFTTCKPRIFPSFIRGELGLGRTLGMGTFCRVAEILEIRLKPNLDPRDMGGRLKIDGVEESMSAGGSGGAGKSLSEGGGGSSSAGGAGRDPGPDRASLEDGFITFQDMEQAEDWLDQVGHDKHYDMSPLETRKFMERKCLRRRADGSPPAARYAVKRLRPDLNENERINGAIDLAVEARFLSAVHHPNIVKMRGTVGGNDPLHPGFFIVLDRLYDTLEQRMDLWRDHQKRYGGCCGGLFGADKEELRILMADRLKVCYDVAAVFRYLHSHNLIYRDIKTDNIGFDVRDDVKVFDFGLCKELNPAERTRDGKFYKLTGLTGSFRYMAPEVALSKPYNLSADVYSYGVLVWQILDLRHPFGELNMLEYTEKVAKGGFRPKYVPANKWPETTRKLAEQCWARRPMDRPDFEKIAAEVKRDLMITSYDSNGSIANRSAHMQTRSQCSGDSGSVTGRERDFGAAETKGGKVRPDH